MLQFERWKVVLVLFLTVMGILYAAPDVAPPKTQAWLAKNMPGWLPSGTINLGLDLQGGSHLLLQADINSVVKDRVASMEDAARNRLRHDSIGYVDLAAKADGITFKLRHPAADHAAAYKIASNLEDRAAVDISSSGVVSVTLGEDALKALNAQVIQQSIEIVRRRIDETGTKEPVIEQQGENRIVVELPGVADPEHVKQLLGKTAKMSFHLVDMNATDGQPLPGDVRMPMQNDPGQSVVIREHAVLTGDMLVDSQPTFEQGEPVVSFRFNSIGATRFCDVTRDNTGKPFAIVLDDKVISAPRINEPICGGSGIITGGFTVKQAQDLSLLLRSGALPAPLKVIEERSVGPSLGSDSVAAGKVAASVAMGAVLVLMTCSYGLFGIFADIALILNMVFIFALLSMLQATLTLPGIAGIILTIGIAVDANVLVYERIREELRAGRSVLAAVDAGYVHAKATIIDSNITTLTVAVILFSFGTGPVKGFAVSMSIGIITSLFAALMLTRLMIVTWLRKARPTKIDI
ncbi:MAG: protein translocase subunit SecD [Alphaproteobacteria bacterium]|nr:protein translocase subunit SecD [Alphaproteobacteria bacterium]